jgi:hypothetical protein
MGASINSERNFFAAVDLVSKRYDERDWGGTYSVLLLAYS